MLNLFGSKKTLCDGMTRRDMLRVGALAVGGLTLTDLLRAEQAAGKKSAKSVIMVYMCGAPGHQDMYDLKMNAPAEIRGEFRPIPTNVPGVEICEHMPRMAAIMDKLVPLRSVYGSPDGDHDSFICYTGRSKRQQPPGGWPSVGSTISKVLGPRSKSVPSFVGLSPDTGHPPYGSPGLPGYLGVSHAAFRPSGPGRADMVLNGIDATRLGDRKALLASVDQIRREVDASGTMIGMDSLARQAFEILTSSKLVDALDLSKEDAATREPLRQRGHEELRRRSTAQPRTFFDGSAIGRGRCSRGDSELRPLGFPQRQLQRHEEHAPAAVRSRALGR